MQIVYFKEVCISECLTTKQRREGLREVSQRPHRGLTGVSHRNSTEKLIGNSQGNSQRQETRRELTEKQREKLAEVAQGLVRVCYRKSEAI